MLKVGLFSLSLLASLSLATVLVPVAPYIGKNNPTLDQPNRHTGALVDSKIYTFGGVFQLPYVVDPNDDDDDEDGYGFIMRRQFNNVNVTDMSYVYDTLTDEWKFETKTPTPWAVARTVVVDKSIYFYNIIYQNDNYDFSSYFKAKMEVHKYDTLTKQWSQKPNFAFLFSDELASCYINSNIYFTAIRGHENSGNTIIHSYNVNTDQWDENIIFPTKNLNILGMLCTEYSLKVIAEEVEVDPITGEQLPLNSASGFIDYPTNKQELFTIYYDGRTVAHHLDIQKKGAEYYESEIAVLDDNFYIYEINTNEEKREATVSRLNAITLVYEVMGPNLPYNFSRPLLVPTKYDEVFLFGGSQSRNYGSHEQQRSQEATPKVKKWNHKLVFSNSS